MSINLLFVAGVPGLCEQEDEVGVCRIGYFKSMYVNSFIQGIRARFYDITPCSQFQSSISCATTFTTGASFSSQ